VVVATRDGWTKYRSMFDAHRKTLDAVGGELIVADGSDDAVPAATDLGPLTTWLKHPGESVPALRARAYQHARGSIIAQSEDHVLVPPDWGAAILRAHDEFPDAAAIGGPSENGSTHGVFDWASYFVGHGRFAPQLGIGTPSSLLGMMNVSYKRWAIAGMESVGGAGVNEVMHQRALRRSGATLLHDDRIRGFHVQRTRFGTATSLVFHAGRAMAGMRRSRMNAREWSRVGVTPIVAPALTARLGLMMFRRRRYRREFVAAMPAVMWLFACRSAGELIGYATGPGDSLLRLH
jgi:hypothetical protein